MGDREGGFSCLFASPESIMNLTPSMVREVSAIFVEIMHFLTPGDYSISHQRIHKLAEH